MTSTPLIQYCLPDKTDSSVNFLRTEKKYFIFNSHVTNFGGNPSHRINSR